MKSVEITVQATDQGVVPRMREAQVIVEMVESSRDLPPQWQPVGSTSIDELVIEIAEDEDVKEKLPQVKKTLQLS